MLVYFTSSDIIGSFARYIYHSCLLKGIVDKFVLQKVKYKYCEWIIRDNRCLFLATAMTTSGDDW